MEEGCPPLLNVLRICDIPQVMGALAPKPVKLLGVNSSVAGKVKAIYQAAGASNELDISDSL